MNKDKLTNKRAAVLVTFGKVLSIKSKYTIPVVELSGLADDLITQLVNIQPEEPPEESKKIQDHREALLEVQRQRDAALDNNHDLIEDKKELKATNQSLATEVREVQAERDKAMGDWQRALAANRSILEDKKGLNARIDELREELKMPKWVERENTINSTLVIQNQGLAEKVKDLESALSHADGTIQSLQGTISDLNKVITKHKDDWAWANEGARDKELEAIQDQVTRQIATYTKLSKELLDLKNDKEWYKKEIGTVQDQRRNMKEELIDILPISSDSSWQHGILCIAEMKEKWEACREEITSVRRDAETIQELNNTIKHTHTSELKELRGKLCEAASLPIDISWNDLIASIKHNFYSVEKPRGKWWHRP